MEEFKKAYSSLNDAQRKAVDQLDGPVLVIAGPGTGKTQLLTTRIANILSKTDTLPQNILCLTFTESAAHNMRERLSAMIGKAAYDVYISTYHSFGSELIRRYPEYFAQDTELRAIDELGIDSLLREIQSALPYKNNLKQEFYLKDIKSLLSDFKRALISPGDVNKIVKENRDYYSQVNKELRVIFRNFKRVDKKSIELFTQLLDASRKIPSPKKIGAILAIKDLWVEELDKCINEAQETGKTTPLTKWKNSWLAKNEHNEFIAAGISSNDKLADFADIYKKYEIELDRQKLFDYDDMIGRAINGLEQYPELRYTIQEQYLYVLLDEFQDTNGAQLRLIELLTDNPTNEGRPNVLAVGDDDQAIYAFQGADYSNMLTYKNMYQNVAVISLDLNYRSTMPIVALSNAIASQIQERLHKYIDGTEKSLYSALPESIETVIQRNEFKSDLAQYASVAKEISSLLKSGLEANEIAVLAPQHKYLEPLVAYLHHSGIAVRYEKRENVLNDPIISNLVVMAKLVSALTSQDYDITDSLWPEVLSADYWNVSTLLIWELSWTAYDQKKRWNTILLENPITKPIAMFFIRLSTLVNSQTLETALDYLIGISTINFHENDEQYRSPFYDYYFSEEQMEGETGTFWQLLSNLTVLRQHLREYRNEGDKPLLLDDLLEFIEAHRNANINIINTSPYHDSSQAVQLMTAYKAKGQEFRVVFVLGVLDEVWGSSARRRGSTITLPENLRFIRYAGATSDERLRLFYVALTRAKTHLYLSSYTSTYSSKPLDRLKFLEEVVEPDGQVISPFLPAKSQLVKQTDSTAPELVNLSLYWQERHLASLTKSDLKSMLEPRLERFQLSPTHLSQYTDVLRDGPKLFFINTLLKFPKSRMPSAEYGSSIHEVLEWIHLYNKENGKLPSENKIHEVLEGKLRAKRLMKDQTKLLIERGKSSLNSYLKQRKDSFSPANKSEFNFRREGVFIGNAHLTGNIDKLVVDNKEKSIVIVDYKTGKSHSRWSSELVLHKYRQQLYCYKMLVENSHTFSGYTVKGACLEFVEPDSRGNINELRLNFDEKEQKHITSLINGVWQSVMALNFPDVSEFPKSIKGIELFEEQIIKNINDK